MFCNNCGKEIGNNSNFCDNCGFEFVKIKKSTLFDFKQEQSGKNVFIYYILMSLMYIVLSILLIPIFVKNYNPNDITSGFESGQQFSAYAAPVFAFIFSMLFFVPKKLYKNQIAYILIILAMCCPPFLGFIFIVFLATFKNE